jgi:hypothetical protein
MIAQGRPGDLGKSEYIMKRLGAIFLAATIFSTIACPQERSDKGLQGAKAQIISELKTEFQKQNPIIAHVELFDVRPLLLNPIDYPEKPNHYLVVARGVRSDRTFHGKWDDELIGVFLFDDSLYAVERALAIIPTEHWGDFILKVVKIWKDSVTVQGFDSVSGDTTSFVRRYYLLK